jgi:hypothetical protein
MKKSPKIDLNKAKILFQKSFFTCLKNIQKIISHVNVNLTKTWLGNFLGNFSLSFGDFFTKTSGRPVNEEDRSMIITLEGFFIKLLIDTDEEVQYVECLTQWSFLQTILIFESKSMEAAKVEQLSAVPF